MLYHGDIFCSFRTIYWSGNLSSPWAIFFTKYRRQQLDLHYGAFSHIWRPHSELYCATFNEQKYVTLLYFLLDEWLRWSVCPIKWYLSMLRWYYVSKLLFILLRMNSSKSFPVNKETHIFHLLHTTKFIRLYKWQVFYMNHAVNMYWSVLWEVCAVDGSAQLTHPRGVTKTRWNPKQGILTWMGACRTVVLRPSMYILCGPYIICIWDTLTS